MGELELFYRFNPKTKDKLQFVRPTVDTIITWQIGSAIHAVVQSMIINLGMTTADECEITFTDKERWCRGTVDIRNVWVPDEEEPILVDIKTAAFIPKTPQFNYQQQLQVYMDCGTERQRERGIILYIDKNHPHKMKEFVIYRDEKILNDIYSKWARVLEAIEFDNEELPKLCCTPNSKQHLRCPARNQCRIGPPRKSL